jgi:sugar O-acyltransferase (sialic acid O-acetyltransferase NeuD family)
MSKGNLIIGAGGHGKVVADAMRLVGMSLLGFVDDNSDMIGQQLLGFPVLGKISQWQEFDVDGLIIAIGSNHIRHMIQQQVEATGRPNWIRVIHPKAVLAETVKVGSGTVVAAGAIVNPDTVIGRHVIINTGATVDHDCVVGDYVHIAPGVHLAGGVKIGDNTFVGIGGVVIPNCHIGTNATIGAGSVVIKDVPAGVTAKGVPARWKS